MKQVTFRKPARRVHTVFLHHTASSNPDTDNVETLRKWHVEENGWDDIGYHFYISANGQIHECRPLSKTPAAQRNHNSGTIAICLFGTVGFSFTNEQKRSLIDLCTQIDCAYGGNIRFRGHKEVAATACPAYKYRDILSLTSDGRMKSGIVTPQKLRESGSRTISGADAGADVAKSGIVIGTAYTGLQALKYGVDTLSGVFEGVKSAVPLIDGILKNVNALSGYTPIILICAGIYVFLKMQQIKKARVDDEEKVGRLNDKSNSQPDQG